MSPDLIVPERVFNPVAEGIECVSLPIPFSIGSVNVYLLEGPPLTLVDTGPAGIPRVLAILEVALRRRGRRLEDIEQLVLTHAHIDHFGLAAVVRRRSGARVVCHALDRHAIEDFEEHIREQSEELIAELPALGYPAVSADRLGEHFGFIRSSAEAVPVDASLCGGDVLRIGADDWVVHHCPGHSAGLVTMHCASRRLLLADDHLLRFITPNPTMYSFRAGRLQSGLGDYVASLLRVRDLDVEVALPGHGPEITAYRARIDEVLRHHEERAQAVLDAVRLEPLTAAQLVWKVFGRLGVSDTYLATREVLGHVLLLIEGGRVHTEESEDGAWRYSSVA
jgi:glyoxylase-like metal-dependent hydrolase (beta-lactamase superfamily II)